MAIDLAGLIWSADIVLFALVVALSAWVIVSALIAEERRSARQFYLERVRDVMAVLAVSDKQVVRQACPEIIDRSSADEFFELARMRDTLVPVQLEEDFRQCLKNARTVAELERTAAGPGSGWSRIQALMAVGASRSERAFEILRKAVGERDERVAYYAMLGLAQLKTAGAAGILLGLVGDRRFSSQKIASLLEAFPASAAVPELARATHDADAARRFWAVRVLGSFKELCCEQEMLRLCEDTSADVRAAACVYLGRSSATAAQAALRSRLRDQAWFVRLHALRSLGLSAGAAAVEPATALVSDANWFVREEAKRILRHLGVEA